MTNVIQLFAMGGNLRRKHAIVVFEAFTRAYTPSSTLDDWAFEWFDYVDEFGPERSLQVTDDLIEVHRLWVTFVVAHPYPKRRSYREPPMSGTVVLLLILSWMALSAAVGAWWAT